MAKRVPSFLPVFAVSTAMIRDLVRIETARQAVEALPITPRVVAHLRETARLFSTHYSTAIEGNRLTQEQVTSVIERNQHFPGRERDQDEVRGYYAALDEVERFADTQKPVSEASIKRLHALVMRCGRTRVRPTPYRDGQNKISDSRTGRLVYMPPEAKDVPTLMAQLIAWLNRDDDLAVPIKAAIAHYQFATIHPYYDGNGRSARLLTTLILHRGGYGLKGLYALEEYYARDLKSYYDALTVGPSHNYYLGRAEADITGWLAYFMRGMAVSFDKVREQAEIESTRGVPDRSNVLRRLDPQQRRAVLLFRDRFEITAKDIAELFGYGQRNAARLCQRWTATGFLVVADPAKKTRRYQLAGSYTAAIFE